MLEGEDFRFLSPLRYDRNDRGGDYVYDRNDRGRHCVDVSTNLEQNL